jgi:hypothetical protein
MSDQDAGQLFLVQSLPDRHQEIDSGNMQPMTVAGFDPNSIRETESKGRCLQFRQRDHYCCIVWELRLAEQV